VAATAALVTSLSSWALWASPAAASTPAVVTIGFDDGTADQFDQAFPILAAHGMHATFFVNTGPILAGDPAHMTWADLHALLNAGNEITGHTIDHANIKPLSVADAEHQVCDDRNTLLAQGFAPESFAYPFGSFDSTSEAVAHYCGYNSGRGVTGVSKTGPFGEAIPQPTPTEPASRPTRWRPSSPRSADRSRGVARVAAERPAPFRVAEAWPFGSGAWRGPQSGVCGVTGCARRNRALARFRRVPGAGMRPAGWAAGHSNPGVTR